MRTEVHTGLRPETDALRQQANGSSRTMIVLGDSLPYGFGVSFPSSYPCLLEDRLNEGDVSPPWRVINAGVPGDTLLGGIMRFKRDVAAFHPQVLLLAFGLNDAALRRTAYDQHRERLWWWQRSRWGRFRLRMRRLWGYVARLWPKDTQATGPIAHLPEARVRPEVFTLALGDLIVMAERIGAVPWLLSLAPVRRGQVSPAQWASYQRYNRLIREVAHRSGTMLIDVGEESCAAGGAKAASAGTELEGIWQEDGIHLSPEGHIWVADRIYHAVRMIDDERATHRLLDESHTTKPRP